MTGALKVLGHHLRLYRRIWKGSVFLSFVSPILYLGSLGVGLGTLISRSQAHTLGGLSYAAFVAPGMLAATAMMTASSEAMYPIMSRAYWMRTYDAMLATPLAVVDLVGGELLWMLFRLVIVCGFFFLVMLAFGTVSSVFAPIAILVAVISGLAFGLPVMAWAVTQRDDTGFALVFRFAVTPLFILGGTFFPIDRLPQLLQVIAWATPLAHAVALSRALTSGTATSGASLLHLGVILLYVAVGLAAARITFRRQLAT
jgi:lipooligosaccharide transport system permease protein